MFGEDLDINSAGSYRARQLRTRPDIKQAQIGFNVVQDAQISWGAYRPARNLPVAFKKGSHVDKEGYVFPQGRILGKYDPQVLSTVANAVSKTYQADPKQLGVAAAYAGTVPGSGGSAGAGINTGKFYGFVDHNAPSNGAYLVDWNDSQYGYSQDIEGIVAPMNGYKVAAVQDQFSDLDTTFNAIDPVTGNAITSGMNATLRDKGDPATGSLKLAGVAIADTMRETRNNNYQYQRMIEAIAVVKEGWIVLPYVIGNIAGEASANATLALDSGAPALNSAQRAASLDQMVLYVQDPGLLKSGASVNIDAWGNALLTADTDYNGITFGTLVDFSTAIQIPWAKYVNTYPGVEVAGTGTGGIMHQIFYLARKIKGPTFSVPGLSDHINNSAKYGFAAIYFKIP